MAEEKNEMKGFKLCVKLGKMPKLSEEDEKGGLAEILQDEIATKDADWMDLIGLNRGRLRRPLRIGRKKRRSNTREEFDDSLH